MIHIGYYIIGKKRRVHKDIPDRECEGDRSHQIDGSMNFCPECGARLISVIKVDTRTLNIYDIPEDEGCVEDHLLFPVYTPAKDNEVIGISNFRACGNFEVINEDVIVDLDDLEKAQLQQYTDFMDRHERDIKLLRKYVYDDLEIKYGLFTYDY